MSYVKIHPGTRAKCVAFVGVAALTALAIVVPEYVALGALVMALVLVIS